MTRHRPILVLALAFLAGCSTKSNQGPAKSNEKDAKTDPWPAAATIIRKQPDVGGARQAFAFLSTELADNPDFDVPQPLSPVAAKALGDRLRLTPDETRDVASAHFTNLDAAYLTECLILRDAIRSLDLGSLPVERKVRLAFDWVCRQVYLKQGLIITANGPSLCPTLPPQYSLLRGYGSGLDRAYLFLAVLQQLGLDGCLVGPPDREVAASIGIENNRATKGPFWAVGCRLADGTIQLFDPWRGKAFPGPGGTTGNLVQALAGSDSLKPWLEDKAQPWDVTAADLKAATVYVALPYSAAAPRMKMLEAKTATEVGAKLYRDPAEQLDRFGPKAKIWSPPAERDPFCLTRTLSSFLPVEEGGIDRSDSRELRLFEQVTKLSQIPFDLFSPPPEITRNEVRSALKALFLRRFAELIVDLNPRERIGRGQYNDVIRSMVERERQLGGARERARLPVKPEESVAQWAETANELYEKLSLARLPQNASQLPGAQAAIEQFWQGGGPVLQLIDDRRIVPVCVAELGYILAVCKHEQAERASIRMVRMAEKDAARAEATAAAKDAWIVAKDAWDRYFAAAEPFLKADPDRAAHARKLATRAGRLAVDPAAE